MEYEKEAKENAGMVMTIVFKYSTHITTFTPQYVCMHHYVSSLIYPVKEAADREVELAIKKQEVEKRRVCDQLEKQLMEEKLKEKEQVCVGMCTYVCVGMCVW